jgi:hypothetical protein
MLTCVDADQVVVSFEPEGMQHTLVRDDCCRVEMFGPDDGDPEISYSPDGLIIGLWSTADLRVWNKAGRELPT